MANDAASSMSNLTAITPGTNAPPRHVGLPVRDTTSGTVITAEIPAVRAGPAYGVLLPDGSIWYPGSKKRLPAPLVLRVVVWALAFAIFFAAVGDFVIRYHPSWVAPLRHVVPAQSAPAPPSRRASTKPPGARASGASANTAASASAVALLSPQPSGLAWAPLTAYGVRKAPYTVTVTAGGNPAWVSGQAYVGGQLSGPVTQQTLAPGKTLLVPANGSMLVHIGAGSTTIQVYNGFVRIATVPTPPHCPCFLLFEPTGH